MKFTIASMLAVLATASLAFPVEESANVHLNRRGGPEICTNKLDGTGGTNYQVTKDCCAAVHQAAFFNEVIHVCEPNGGVVGNSIDTGEMVICCTSRGCGSAAV
ncbi:hypothetical protein DL96DRAFT_1615890 [Flagelloscypha sp. PMI_526]|nr:hypothetical protein DL96DRAFT_1615890 [Flagelloscypha sp. PMI_526]